MTSERTPRARPAPLATWYATHGRHDLPWRHSRDRWAVLVAEVMLQQTQVARVEQMWAPFLVAFPDPQTAAAAGAGA
ncbi:MAG TPA: A/G-specific adenine glycosylase, partial [Acidimicrobiia bacterium]